MSLYEHMKKGLIILIFGILIYSCSSTKVGNGKTKYYNEKGESISKDKYYQKFRSGNFSTFISDATNNYRLAEKIESGSITNKRKFDSILLKELSEKYNPSLPSVFIFYPGKDDCNSANNRVNYNPIRNKYFSDLEKGLDEICKHNIFYIYKNKTGLNDGNKGFKKWHSDPNEIFERLFFKRHYICGSYVIVSKDAKYISEFGEYSKENIWKYIKFLEKL